jgi:hypothetical protein
MAYQDLATRLRHSTTARFFRPTNLSDFSCTRGHSGQREERRQDDTGLVLTWCPFSVDGCFRPAGTEWDSKSATPFRKTASVMRSRACCYEEGCFRGARFFSTERNPTPVNARRREIGCRAFCVLCQFWQGFATFWRSARRSLFRERTSGVRKGPSRFLPQPVISGQNSRSL